MAADCRTGCDAIVDDDRATVREVVARSRAAYRTQQAIEVASFAPLDLGELFLGEPSGSADLAVHDHHAVLADGAHGQFGLAGNTELADDDHVQRRADCRGDLGSNGNPTARQPEHWSTAGSNAAGSSPASVSSAS